MVPDLVPGQVVGEEEDDVPGGFGVGGAGAVRGLRGCAARGEGECGEGRCYAPDAGQKAGAPRDTPRQGSTAML